MFFNSLTHSSFFLFLPLGRGRPVCHGFPSRLIYLFCLLGREGPEGFGLVAVPWLGADQTLGGSHRCLISRANVNFPLAGLVRRQPDESSRLGPFSVTLHEAHTRCACAKTHTSQHYRAPWQVGVKDLTLPLGCPAAISGRSSSQKGRSAGKSGTELVNYARCRSPQLTRSQDKCEPLWGGARTVCNIREGARNRPPAAACSIFDALQWLPGSIP